MRGRGTRRGLLLGVPCRLEAAGLALVVPAVLVPQLRKETGMTTEIAKVEFKQIQLEDLKEAPYNPRRSFDDDTLKELADSIRAKGVLSPLLVRAVNNHFEIVGGARRYRAAKKAGLKYVPCTVRKFTDDEALEAAVIDNLQRQDVAPLEEARGYQELIKRGHKVEDLAKKVGKSERYIYARLELQKLSPAVQRALDDGKITPSHAQEIATLDDEEAQKRVLDKAYLKTYYEDDSDEQPIVEPGIQDIDTLLSVRDFKQVVAAEKLGVELIEKLNALKLAGHKAALITESGWYAQKQVIAHGRWKTQGRSPCKFPAKGVLVDGKSRGKVIDVCLTTNCPKHFKNHPVGGPSTPAPKPKSAAEVEREKRAAEQARLKAELEKKIRLEGFRQICNKVREVPKKLVAMLVAREIGFGDSNFDHLEAVVPGFSKMNDKRLVEKLLGSDLTLAKMAAGLAIAGEDFDPEDYSTTYIPIGDMAKLVGVNLKSLEKGIRGKFAAEQREQEKLAKVTKDALGGVKAKKLKKAPKKK